MIEVQPPPVRPSDMGEVCVAMLSVWKHCATSLQTNLSLQEGTKLTGSPVGIAPRLHGWGPLPMTPSVQASRLSHSVCASQSVPKNKLPFLL